MELFVSVEDISIPLESVKTQMETKMSQPEPVKEIIKPTKAPRLKIQNPEMVEPVKEVKKEAVEVTPEEPIKDPVRETKEEPIQIESKSIIQPAAEDKEAFFSPRPQIKEPEIIKPVREDNAEPVREVKKESEEEVKEESIRIESNSINKAEPVKEVNKEQIEKIEDKPKRLESYSVNQPATESREAFFVPPVSNITEGNTGLSTEERLIGMASSVGKQPTDEIPIGIKSGMEKQQPVNHNVTESDTGNPIETIFGASIAPAFLHKEMPVYPMMARRLGREGKVLLRLTVDERGYLLKVEVIEKAGYGFTEAAVEAVKKSTFLPAKKEGRPVASRVFLPIKFQLERK